MAPSTQAALLRTLQQRTVTRLGGSQEIPIDVRIISATHRDLLAEVAAGRFRQDLYYRLVVYPIFLPPLRERRGDLPLLIRHLTSQLHQQSGMNFCQINPEAMGYLERYSWPGNVRELQNVLQRALLTCKEGEIQPRHLPPEVRGERPGSDRRHELPPAQAPTQGATGKKLLKEAEAAAIRKALAEVGGHVGRAAELLGISRATLYRRLSTLE
jgi:DNA-binding NtrC family response regulator